jgi:FHS family glucose/mannose:H+ symporter-like MFS transporter
VTFDSHTGPETELADVTFRPLAMASATADLIVFGMLSSLFGPLLVTFAQRFHISLPDAGVVLSVYFVGAFCGVPIGWYTIKHLTGNVVLTITLLTMAIGACGAALSPNWFGFLASIFFMGVGFGGVDFSLITLLVRTRLDGRARRLSVSNAGYGLGAVIGPVLIVLVHPNNYRYLLGAIALSAVVLTFGNSGIVAPPMRNAPHRDTLEVSAPQRRRILGTFIAAYILYVATETTTAGWIAPQIHRGGYSASLGSAITAGFWLGLAFGRVLAGPVGRRHSDRRLVLGGLACAAALCAGAYATGAALYLYPLVGFALALVYPMGLIWYTALLPHDGDGVALLILCMMAGGVIGPAIESVMVSSFGIRVVPLVLCGFALACLAVFSSALRFSPSRSSS